MVLAIITNIGKMSGYLIIGASRAVLQKTLATGDNLGEITTKLGTLGMLMHCFGAATALTLIHHLGFWGQLGAISAGAAVGFYAPVRASQCVAEPITLMHSLHADGHPVRRGEPRAQRTARRPSSAQCCTAPRAALWVRRCVVMSTVTLVSLRRLVKRWADERGDASSASSSGAPTPADAAHGPPPPWACPSPEQLHNELAARWSVVYSLADEFQ